MISDDVAASAINQAVKRRSATPVIRAKEMAVLLALDFKKSSFVAIFDCELDDNLKEYLFKLKQRYPEKLALVEMRV